MNGIQRKWCCLISEAGLENVMSSPLSLSLLEAQASQKGHACVSVNNQLESQPRASIKEGGREGGRSLHMLSVPSVHTQPADKSKRDELSLSPPHTADSWYISDLLVHNELPHNSVAWNTYFSTASVDQGFGHGLAEFSVSESFKGCDQDNSWHREVPLGRLHLQACSGGC